MNPPLTLPPERARRFKARLVTMILAMNLAGGLVLFLYYTFIDLPRARAGGPIIRWETLALLCLPAALSAAYTFYYSRPVFNYLATGQALDDQSGESMDRIKKRALRFPLVCSLATIVSWVLAGLLVAIRFWLWGREFGLQEAVSQGPDAVAAGNILAEQFFEAGVVLKRQWSFLVQSLKLMGIGLVIGAIVSAAHFFIIESQWQREIPRFFPGGKLSSVGDRLIIPVRVRLIVIFLIVGTVPLVAFGVLSYQRTREMIYLPPELVLKNLLMFNAFMVAVGVGLALLLSGFVARSVSKPLEKLREAMEMVKSGYYWLQLPVRANDELGTVTEGFNEMVRALGEKESSIIELTRDLEDKVKERTRELSEVLAEKERAQAKLIHSEKMASLGQLVAGVAHEINNPVGYIYANTDHMEKFLQKMEKAQKLGELEEFKKDRDRMVSLIEGTREGARRAKEIVQGLRAFSRQDPSNRAPVDLREAIQVALMLVGHELKRGIQVKTEFKDVPPVIANAGEISQVMVNLIVNAIQAMDKDGKIEITVDENDGKARIRITDNGQGIPAENLPRLFEPFFTTKGVGGGTGLGLAITYGIVRAHGGEILVDSEPGKGTTFTVLLPVT